MGGLRRRQSEREMGEGETEEKGKSSPAKENLQLRDRK